MPCPSLVPDVDGAVPSCSLSCLPAAFTSVFSWDTASHARPGDGVKIMCWWLRPYQVNRPLLMPITVVSAGLFGDKVCPPCPEPTWERQFESLSNLARCLSHSLDVLLLTAHVTDRILFLNHIRKILPWLGIMESYQMWTENSSYNFPGRWINKKSLRTKGGNSFSISQY